MPNLTRHPATPLPLGDYLEGSASGVVVAFFVGRVCGSLCQPLHVGHSAGGFASPLRHRRGGGIYT